MENSLFVIVEGIVKYAFAPLVALVWYMFKRLDKKVEVLEQRMNAAERTTDVLEAKLDDVKEELVHIRNGVDILLHERRK